MVSFFLPPIKKISIIKIKALIFHNVLHFILWAIDWISGALNGSYVTPCTVSVAASDTPLKRGDIPDRWNAATQSAKLKSALTQYTAMCCVVVFTEITFRFIGRDIWDWNLMRVIRGRIISCCCCSFLLCGVWKTALHTLLVYYNII